MAVGAALGKVTAGSGLAGGGDVAGFEAAAVGCGKVGGLGEPMRSGWGGPWLRKTRLLTGDCGPSMALPFLSLPRVAGCLRFLVASFHPLVVGSSARSSPLGFAHVWFFHQVVGGGGGSGA